jgi:homocysteine S-methyltransferase
MNHKFIDLLDREILLCDGAMGTMLLGRGVEMNALAVQNLINPDLVRSIHLEYIRAGARIIETNTFLANRMQLKEYGVEDRLEDINRAGVRLAREAVRLSREEIFVAGSVGPLGALVKPYGNLTLADLADAYTEQISALVDEGVDLIIIETHPSLLETLEAVRAARTVSPTTPIVAQMTFFEDGKSKFGDTLPRSMEALAAADADVVGTNCSGPQMTYDLMQDFLRQTDLRVSVMTNAGVPQLIGGRQIYLSSPEYMKEYARRFVETGANIIGGCCGTTPEHIRAMSEVVTGQAPRRIRERAAVSVQVSRPAAAPEAGAAVPMRSNFRDKLGREFVVTVEIPPPRGLNYEDCLAAIRTLADLGVDAVQVSDSTTSRVRLSSIALAHLIQTNTGVETVLHFACRDRNITTIQSELLGVAALGIKNVLALTGTPETAGELPHVTSVFAVNATGLVRIIHGLNHGRTMTGNDIGQPTEFRIGVAANPAAEDLDAEFAKLQERLEAGAHFAQTQPIYDLDLFERFWRRFESLKAPLLIGVLPLTSTRHAEFLHHEVPGITIPEQIRQRLRQAEERGAVDIEGQRVASEFIKQVRNEVAGIYVTPQANHVGVLKEIIAECAASTSA